MAMNDTLRLAQLIYSAWIVSADPDDAEGRFMPTAPGLLDHTLFGLKQRHLLPDWAENRLTFVEGTTGLICLELPDIQRIATEAKLSKDPNPSYTSTEVSMTPRLAEYSLSRLGLSLAEAQEFGANFRAEARRAMTEHRFN